MNNKGSRVSILFVVAALMVTSLYALTISDEKEILIIGTSVFSGFLVLVNFIIIFKNMSVVNKNKRKLSNKEVKKINIHPLELFLINRAWKHSKELLKDFHIYAGVRYELEKGHIVVVNNSIMIEEETDLSKLDKYSLKIIEMAMLDSTEYMQLSSMRLTKLNKLKKDKQVVTIDEIKNNIKENCKNRNILTKLSEEVKIEYFDNDEGSFGAAIMLLTGFTAILSFVMAISFIQSDDILKFYLPLTAAVILIGTITSGFRDRAAIKEDKIHDMSIVINYIKSMNSLDNNAYNEINKYVLGLLPENNDIVKIFY